MLLNEIYNRIIENPDDIKHYSACMDQCIHSEAENFDVAHQINKKMRNSIALHIKTIKDPKKANEIYKKSLLFDAPYYFDDYLQYIEFNRKPKDKFYQPRRKRLKVVVDALQDLVDDKLDELFVSMPPRVGKTTILLFFVTWIIGRFSERSNLYSAYSDTITSAFYDGVLEILNDPTTYLWCDVFPNSKIANQDAKDETLNIDRKKRYPSLTCRSLYGTLNGACDCNGFLIADDLIGGIEEALNKDRLVAAWSKVDNNLIPRAKENAKKIWVGTRWSLIDPAGNRMALLQSEPEYRSVRYKIINLSALDENDESNFDYLYGVGFSTEYYLQRRASFEKNNDIASWNAQYMGEPIEREGTLFEPGDFRYYNGELPDDKPDRVYMVVDPAFGGGDFVAGPVIYQYGNDLYMDDVVYSNEDKKITQPMIAQKIKYHQIDYTEIEASKTTQAYVEGVEKALKDINYKATITSKTPPNNTAKNQRIFDKSPDIRDYIIFRDSAHRTKEYNQFMQNVFSFKMFAKNLHDDAPDSLAMVISVAFRSSPKAQVFKRPF